MQFDFESLSARERYKLMVSTVVPRPIAWVITQSVDGRNNAAPYSFFGLLSDDPPIISVGVAPRPDGSAKDTLVNIEATGQFTVCLVPHRAVEAMNVTAVNVPTGIDEIALAGLTPVASHRVAPPRLLESPVALECVTYDLLKLGRRIAVLGRVVMLHVRDDCVLDAEKNYIDTPRLDLVARMHGEAAYASTRDLFDLNRLNPADVLDLSQKP